MENTEIVVLDQNTESNIVQIGIDDYVTQEFAEKINKIEPEFFEIDIKQLKKFAEATEQLELLRISFWREVERVKKLKNPVCVSTSKICDTICTLPKFYALIKDKYKLAYILRPTPSYEARLELMHNMSLDILIEGIKGIRGKIEANDPDNPLTEKDLKYSERVNKIAREHLHGKPIQRQESKNLHISANIDANQGQSEEIKKMSAIELEKEIQRLSGSQKHIPFVLGKTILQDSGDDEANE